MLEEDLDPEHRGRFHFFNSFFYKKLTEKNPGMCKLAPEERGKRDHERVKKWTKVRVRGLEGQGTKSSSGGNAHNACA